MGGSAEFIIENDCNSNLTIWVEPEAFPVLLLPDEKIVVRDEFKSVPVTVRVWKDDTGTPPDIHLAWRR
jgi:hypothetical protein